MFDFNKLDDYKVALDDGFWYTKEEDDGECSYNTDYLCFIESQKTYSYYNLNSFGEVEIYAEDKDWETFKKKVADYFLGVEEK